MTHWKQKTCYGCGGHGMVSDYSGGDFNGPKECECCNGSGRLYVSFGGAIAQWPGGPFVGKLTKKELEDDPRRI